MQNRLSVPDRIVIVTHTVNYGATEALRDYFINKKIPSLIYIGHPLLADNPYCTYERYAFGKEISRVRIKRSGAGSFLSYFLDIFRTISLLIRQKNYVYIGVNPINACCGLLLRSVGLAKKVVYYGIDFTPKRFNNLAINWLYHYLERIGMNADIVWNVSPRIAEGRAANLGILRTQQVVPIGVWKKDINKFPKQKIGTKIIFVGHLLEKQGIQEVIKALPMVLEHFPEVQFTIIGGGEYETTLKNLSMEIKHAVTFLGWQSDQEFIRTHIRNADIAVATYVPTGEKEGNFTYYADPTKIKTYLSCGIPVIMTDVAFNARMLEKKGCVFVVEYNASDIAKKCIELLSHPNKLREAQKKAIEYAHTITWEQIFDKAVAAL